MRSIRVLKYEGEESLARRQAYVWQAPGRRLNAHYGQQPGASDGKLRATTN